MIRATLSPTGRFADVCRHGDVWLVVWHELARQTLVVQGITDDGTLVERIALALHEDAAAFPRIASHDDAWWLVAKDGLPGYPARLWQDGQPRWTSPAPAWGNDPVALGPGGLAWQGADQVVHVAPWAAPQTWAPARLGAPTGLSRVLPGGIVTLVDEDRTAVPGGTRPCWAGAGVVLEAPEGGVWLRTTAGRGVWLWPGAVTYTPRLAAAAGDRYAVVTWAATGVQLALVGPEDLGIDHPPTWATPGTWVDTLPYLVPNYAGRLQAADGQTLQSVRTGPAEITCLKGAPDRQEIWRWDDQVVRLVYDATDGRDGRPWRVAPAPVWAPRLAQVGAAWVAPPGTRLVRWEGDHSEVHPFPVRTTVAAYGAHVPCGALGVCRVLITTWEPGWPVSGYVERHWWAIREADGRRLGRVRYEEWRDGRLARATDFHTLVPDDPPMTPAPPIPIPDPVTAPPEEPPMPMAFPPRDETLAFLSQLETRYRDAMQRPARETHIDPEGTAVWLESYLRYRVHGRGHEAAVAAVMADIDRVLGLEVPVDPR